jgi:hypothetical protein
MTFHADEQRADFHAEAAGKPGRATGSWDGERDARAATDAPRKDPETGPTGERADHEWAMLTGLMRRYNG